MRYILTLYIVFIAPLALSQPLTPEAVRGFVNSLPEVHSFTENQNSQVSQLAFEEEMMPRAGEPFAPYSRALDMMRDNHAEIYQGIEDLIGNFGFATAEEWATTGDRVIAAFIATQISSSDMEQMEQMTPEMLNQVPAQMRPQIERMLAMMATIRETPEADIEVVRPLAGELQQVMNLNGGQ
ncbi:MAG: hypothetical protein WD396_00430 [Pseudohongiellaceae bacterium]